MSFRIIPDRKNSFNSEIGLLFLDEQFRPLTRPQLLQLRDEYAVSPCRAEDARLMVHGERLYVLYDDNTEAKVSKGGFRVYFAEIAYDGEHFIADSVECLDHFEGASRDTREKAWTPFIYEDTLLLAYKLDPLKVFRPFLDGSGRCKTVCNTNPPVPWKWGEIRGGTPAYKEGDVYLGFFHSSAPMMTVHSDYKKILHYFVGAYTFSAKPPFALQKISPEPIVGTNFYEGTRYKPFWKPVRSVFPCGYISDEKSIWITYGRDDHEIWVAKLDKEKLLQSLVPM